MAVLTTITADADGTIGATVADSDTDAAYFDDCNDSPDGLSSDWIANDQSESDAVAWLSLANVDSDFSSMDTLDIDVDVDATSFVDDTCTLTCRIYNADNDTTTPLTNETGNLATQADTTRTQRNVTFAGLAGSKSDWDGAYIRFTWTYAKSGKGDDGQVRLYGFDIDGTYTAAGAASPKLEPMGVIRSW